ncbi:acid phosphatase AphA [Vibrio mediterranei]|uniref:acid phosphatase AphA n=1 Tax=Vibrio mediterranei TaxID=689 RepID=UPI00228395A0|nr:acid phosphatase AphA [Vibrio mediterranei]MCY9854085.1 acid phosphatase AphA [Vibrio mediterranei]
MNIKSSLKLITLSVLLASPLSFAKVYTTTDMQAVSHQAPQMEVYKDINWVSVSDIQKQLPDHPITVGLDIDDTMLFSSPVFYRGQQKYSPGSNAYLKNQDFWNEASTGWDDFSLPKHSALALVNMHLAHGDTIYFITGRNAPAGKETLTSTIRHLFPKDRRDQIKPVVFAGGLEKEKQLKQAGVEQYYGDSDSDITSSMHVGIKAIRFLRNEQSTYVPMPQAGKYGEPVLIGSNY